MSNGSVLVVGAGLIGTSIGLALRGRREVFLDDRSADQVAVAVGRGAGRHWCGESVDLVVAAVPVSEVAGTLARMHVAAPDAWLTHVASVQSLVQQQLADQVAVATATCGSHPMAGREVSGPEAAEIDLFTGRPWLVCPSGLTDPEASAAVEVLATDCGARPVRMTAAEHDRLVALASHLPQVAASAVAAQLLDAAADDVALSGPGLRDTTRVAASDPVLWREILSANRTFVGPLVRALAAELLQVADALDGEVPLDVVEDLLRRGRQGRELVPVDPGA